MPDLVWIDRDPGDEHVDARIVAYIEGYSTPFVDEESARIAYLSSGFFGKAEDSNHVYRAFLEWAQ